LITLKSQWKKILLGSVIGLCMSLPAQYLYTEDWWYPLNISGTRLGLEDILFGFFYGGVAIVGYPLMSSSIQFDPRNVRVLRIIFIIGLGFLTMSTSLYVIHLNSYISTIISVSVITILINLVIKQSPSKFIIDGLYNLTLTLIVYWVLYNLNPSWIDSFYFEKSRESLLSFIPNIELFWYFSIGGLFPLALRFVSPTPATVA
ncbi:MAG TPA: hypothetical protein PLV59_03505, partial [Candidatus Dojkabacteria bacterium]|nr:hypothetical protein [Candidatus Dojkabacteria bacterium]